MEKHWAYCPDRNGVCGVVVAHGEHAARDAERMARMGAELDQTRRDLEREHEALLSARRTLAVALAEIRDLERENAALRRRLREGGR